jgi:hypothetical protein
MADTTAIPTTLLLPRYVAVFQNLGRRAGFTVADVAYENFDFEDYRSLLSAWTGDGNAGRKLTFLCDTMRGQLRRIGIGCTGLIKRGHIYPFRARVHRDRGALTMTVNYGDAPDALAMDGDVEIATYSDGEKVCHGTKAALMARGFSESIFPNKRGLKGYDGPYQPERKWWTLRLTDGSYRHWTESQARYKERVADLGARLPNIAQEAARADVNFQRFMSCVIPA